MIIFDSGIGGFSILKELPPNCAFTYLADQAYFPYGSKTQADISKRLHAIASFAKEQNPDLLVVACNTATVNGVSIFRALLNCPVVAVEPVVKPAKNHRKTLILATASTLASLRLAQLRLDHKAEIATYTPTKLPEAIEAMDLAKARSVIQKIKKVAQKVNASAVGLSCTHYPLVKTIFQESMKELSILDPSRAVAAQITKLLAPQPGKQVFLTTGNVLSFKDQISYYLGVNSEPTHVTIPR